MCRGSDADLPCSQIAAMSDVESTNASDVKIPAARAPSKNSRFFIETIIFLVGGIDIVVAY